MTPADLRALADAATPGPWLHDHDDWQNVIRKSDPPRGPGRLIAYVGGSSAMGHNGHSDAALIAACRTAVPALLDENAALRARCEQLEEELREDATADLVAMGVDVEAERVRFAAKLDELEERALVRAKVRLSEVETERDTLRERVAELERLQSLFRAGTEERDTALARAEKAEAQLAALVRGFGVMRCVRLYAHDRVNDALEANDLPALLAALGVTPTPTESPR